MRKCVHKNCQNSAMYGGMCAEHYLQSKGVDLPIMNADKDSHKDITCKHDGPNHPCNRPAKGKDGYCSTHANRKRKGYLMDQPIRVYEKTDWYSNVECFDFIKNAVIEIPKNRVDDGGIRIYQLVFSDGTTYVGQTVQSIRERLHGHKRGDSSHGVEIRLKSELLTHIFLHGIFEDRDTAWKVEQQLNTDLRENGWDVINKSYTPFGFISSDREQCPRIPGKLRCRICFQFKAHKEFYRDSHRSSGRANVCIQCKKNFAKVSYHGKKLGIYPHKNPVIWQTFRKKQGQIKVSDFDWDTLTVTK